MKTAINLAERGFVPDWLTRHGIRHLLRDRLREVYSRDEETNLRQLLARMNNDQVAVHADAANQQHYEVPTEFFRLMLGPRLKYSACLWSEGVNTLASAEEAMLALTCERAELRNGQHILELGCGWGSLSIWMAEHYADSRITAVSNSRSQVAYIRELAARRGLSNLRVVVSDMNHFSAGSHFDRVVSVEMFEHMRNIGELLARIRQWLAPQGRLFVHIFAHRQHAYPFEARGDSDWMSRYFFTGGLMPSETLLSQFPQQFDVQKQWRIAGTHYASTLESWLARLDARKEAAADILKSGYGKQEGALWLNRWRMFLLACSELFAYRGGQEWGVSHYLMARSGERC